MYTGRLNNQSGFELVWKGQKSLSDFELVGLFHHYHIEDLM
jgi:hypothetical protein